MREHMEPLIDLPDPETAGGNAADPRRLERLEEIRLDVAGRLARGESVSLARVQAAHPDLMPELGEELRLIELTHRQLLAAHRSEAPVQRPATHADETFTLAVAGFRIIKELDTGGQGVVFHAEQLSTGREVAVKVFVGGALLIRRRQARLEREVSILASLQHPNIVGVLDRGRAQDGSFYLVMDYINGPELGDWVTQRRAIEPPAQFVQTVLKLFFKIAAAAGEAHAQGIVHRDLKPSNIRIDVRNEPHLLDFGLARITTDDEALPATALSVTMDGNVVGSLPWLSPEQAAGTNMDVDARSDVYSLGVMLYEALTGREVYSRQGRLADILLRIQDEVPPPPSRRIPAITPQIDAVVMKALAKSREARYAGGSAMAQDLAACIQGQQVIATPHRHPASRVRFAMAACLVLLLLLLGGTFSWLYLRSKTSTNAALPPATAPAGHNMPPPVIDAPLPPGVSRRPLAPGQSRVVLTPVDDAFVRDGPLFKTPLGVPSADKADVYRELHVKNSETVGKKRDAYLRFDISSIPKNHQVYRAFLRLYGHSVLDVGADPKTTRPVDVGAFPLRDPIESWDAQEITWFNRPYLVGYDSIATSINHVKVEFGKERWNEMDVGPFIREERKQNRLKVSFGLHDPEETNAMAVLHSAEGENPPLLEIIHGP